jgi:hypothetical protein
VPALDRSLLLLLAAFVALAGVAVMKRGRPGGNRLATQALLSALRFGEKAP